MLELITGDNNDDNDDDDDDNNITLDRETFFNLCK